MISQGALLGVPPPKPNVRNSATTHRNIQPRLKGRRTLKPAVTNRIVSDLTRQTAVARLAMDNHPSAARLACASDANDPRAHLGRQPICSASPMRMPSGPRT